MRFLRIKAKKAGEKFSPVDGLDARIFFTIPADISCGTAEASRAVHINITFCYDSGTATTDFL